MNQLKTKDVLTLSISLAMLVTMGTSLLFWHPNSDASLHIPAPAAVAASEQRPPSDPREDIQEVALLKQSIVEERKAKLAEADLALDKKYQELAQKIGAYLQQQQGTYGFSLYIMEDLNGLVVDKLVGYNQDEIFKMASTFKLPVNLYLYRQVAENRVSLDSKLTFSSADYEQGTGSLQYRGPGGKYTVRELASRSIRESDNVAINILLRTFGRENISNFMLSIGGHQLPPSGTPTGSPQDLALYMKAAYEFAQSKPELGNLLMEDLKNTIFQDRIRAGTPANVVVGHKIGNLGGVVNDVAVVYAKKPYFLAIMSKGIQDDSVASQVEAEVAKMVYEGTGQ